MTRRYEGAEMAATGWQGCCIRSWPHEGHGCPRNKWTGTLNIDGVIWPMATHGATIKANGIASTRVVAVTTGVKSVSRPEESNTTAECRRTSHKTHVMSDRHTEMWHAVAMCEGQGGGD